MSYPVLFIARKHVDDATESEEKINPIGPTTRFPFACFTATVRDHDEGKGQSKWWAPP